MDSIPAEARRIVDFLAFSERLKRELRHSWLADGRQESVAEHTWQMTLMALLVYRHLEQAVDLDRALRMIVVHDLVEAECGDRPYFAVADRAAKARIEREAMAKIRTMVAAATGDEIENLWNEFEDAQSAEARFVRALDTLEVQIQHNLAGIATWEPAEFGLVHTKLDGPCSHDGFLRALCTIVKADAIERMDGSAPRS